MCLIIHGPANKIRATLLNTRGMLEDIFQFNGDGVGIMYPTKHGTRVRKWLPHDIKHAYRIIESFPNDDRELAVHWRMRTHGDIDRENCHPYKVGKGWLMHNGVLSTGNKPDPTKSDTWHYCRWFLDDIFDKVAHEPSFVRMLQHHIEDDNKFVMMTEDGRMTIVNRAEGYESNGLWFSNTYAWDPAVLDPTWVDPSRMSWARNGFNTPDIPLWHSNMRTDDPAYVEMTIDAWAMALNDSDYDTVKELLSRPLTNLKILFETGLKAQPYRGSLEHPEIMKLVMTGDFKELAEQCYAGRTEIVAEVIAWYTVWTDEDGVDIDSDGQDSLLDEDELREELRLQQGATHWQDNYGLTLNEAYAG